MEHEVREELREEGELIVINKCRERYAELLRTGPYTTQDTGDGSNMMGGFDQTTKKKPSDDLIKERERLSVLGAVMHQIDQFNFVVTVAVVDRYGELVAHKEFMHLLPPRRRPPQN